MLVQHGGQAERLFILVETKGSLFSGDLRVPDGAMVEAAKRHCQALALKRSAVQYVVATKPDEVLTIVHRNPLLW